MTQIVDLQVQVLGFCLSYLVILLSLFVKHQTRFVICRKINVLIDSRVNIATFTNRWRLSCLRLSSRDV